jgi:hypothetical protein
MFDAMLAPAVIVGALLGRAVLRRLPQAMFDKLVIGADRLRRRAAAAAALIALVAACCVSTRC